MIVAKNSSQHIELFFSSSTSNPNIIANQVKDINNAKIREIKIENIFFSATALHHHLTKKRGKKLKADC
jgi:hypothetical protein